MSEDIYIKKIEDLRAELKKRGDVQWLQEDHSEKETKRKWIISINSFFFARNRKKYEFGADHDDLDVALRYLEREFRSVMNKSIETGFIIVNITRKKKTQEK